MQNEARKRKEEPEWRGLGAGGGRYHQKGGLALLSWETVCLCVWQTCDNVWQ